MNSNFATDLIGYEIDIMQWNDYPRRPTRAGGLESVAVGVVRGAFVDKEAGLTLMLQLSDYLGPNEDWRSGDIVFVPIRTGNGAAVLRVVREPAMVATGGPAAAPRPASDRARPSGHPAVAATARWFSIQEAAAHLRMSTSFVRAAIRDGRLPASRAGRAIRIGPTDLERLIAPHASSTRMKDAP